MLIGKGGGVEGRKDFLPIHVVHVLINVFAAHGLVLILIKAGSAISVGWGV